jgi:hypothetical protein
LAGLRARNTLQGIRNVLGLAFHIPARSTSVEGHGARAAGAVQGVETQTRRRVDVNLNGQGGSC